MDEKLNDFYQTLCDLFSKTKGWPDQSAGEFTLTAGRCQACGIIHDVSVFCEIVSRFWEQGGDVDEDWRRLAKAHGFDPDSLHDIMLGVFVGGDRAPTLLGSLEEQRKKAIAALNAALAGASRNPKSS